MYHTAGPLLLVALAAGYWVLTLSQSQGRPLDLLGRILGGLILLVSVAGLICATVFGSCRMWKKACGNPKLGCPMAAPGGDAPAMPQK